MESTPAVTVLMSVYNGERHLSAAVDSILHQTFTDFEFLIIDDGSTDGSAKLLAGYTDRRIRVISQENQGLVAALNTGLQQARAALIARMDADDIAQPERLEKQLAYLQTHPEVDVVGCGFALFTNESDRPTGYQLPPTDDRDLRRALFVRNPLGHGTITARREVLLAAGGYQDVGPAEDYDLWCRLAGSARFGSLPDILYSWRINPEGISQSQLTTQAELAQRLRSRLIDSTAVPHLPATEIRRHYRKLRDSSLTGAPAAAAAYLEDQYQLVAVLWRQRRAWDAVRQFVLFLRLDQGGVVRFGHSLKHSARALVRRLRPATGPAPARARVMLIRNAFGHDFGGAETYALNLALALREEGYRPLVISRVSSLLSHCQVRGISAQAGPWYAKQGWGRNYRYWGPLVTLWYGWMILRHRIDVVHPQSRDDFLFATRAARLLNRRVVWTDHGDLKYIMQTEAPASLTAAMAREAAYARAVIAVSHSEEDAIRAVAPDFPNLTVVHNGVFPAPAVRALDHSSRYVLGCTSRLVRAKGLFELITAFSGIAKLKQTELWLVGDGAAQAELEHLAADLGVADKVRFFGYQDNVWPYLASLSVFIHPSHHEAFCLSILEAAMAGKPIIATDTGGNPEIVDPKIGVLVPVNDPEALRQAIDNLLAAPDQLTKMGQAAHAKASCSFDFRQIVKTQVAPLYND